MAFQSFASLPNNDPYNSLYTSVPSHSHGPPLWCPQIYWTLLQNLVFVLFFFAQ